MKRYIIACLLILACVVAGLATMQQVEAKSVKKQHIPSITLYIQQDLTTKHNYFTSRPAFLCIRGRVISITIKNTTKQPQIIDWWALYQFVTIQPGKSITSVQHAADMGVDNPNYEIDVVLNYKPAYSTLDAEADIIADGVVKRCIK